MDGAGNLFRSPPRVWFLVGATGWSPMAPICGRGSNFEKLSAMLADALQLADRAYVLQTGAIVQEGSGSDLLKSDMIRKAYLGM